MKETGTFPRRIPSGFFVTMPPFTLVTGGTRSGKSRFAVELAKRLDGPIAYIATCNAVDREMKQRVERHRQARPAHWTTIEYPSDLVRTLSQLNGKVGGAIIDCLTMHVSELLMRGISEKSTQQNVHRLCKAIRSACYPVIVVTNEVGSSVVPDHPRGRQFRDLAGLANQTAASFADEVYLLVAGIPLLIKGHAPSRRSLHASVLTH